MDLKPQTPQEQMEERIRRAEQLAQSADAKANIGLVVSAFAVTTVLCVAIDIQRRHNDLARLQDSDFHNLNNDLGVLENRFNNAVIR